MTIRTVLLYGFILCEFLAAVGILSARVNLVALGLSARVNLVALGLCLYGLSLVVK